MTRLVVTEQTQTDLDGILTYLETEAGPHVVYDYRRRFEATIERLVHFPESGAPRPALGPGIRIAVVSPYILIHRYVGDDDTLTLLRVMHGRRKITSAVLRT
jgi:toxin ParE1/3/4